jgi:hypothetical protein
MYIRFVGLCFLLALSLESFSQAWEMQMSVSIGSHGCLGTIQSETAKLIYNGKTYTASTGLVVVKLINTTDGVFTGTINGTVTMKCTCSDPSCTPFTATNSTSLVINFDPSLGEQCNSSYANLAGPDINIDIDAKFYRKLATPVLVSGSADCSSAVQLTTAGAATTYDWQVTDDPSISSHWKPIVGKTTQSITVIASDLNKTGFNGVTRYVRVNDANCAQRYSGVSDNFNIQMAPPSAASLTWKDPLCFGGDNGELLITSVTGKASTYVFTLYYQGPGSNVVTWQGAQATSSLPLKIDKTAILANNLGNIGIKKGAWLLTIQNATNVSTLGSCSTSFSQVIQEPAAISATLTASNFNGFSLKCNNDNSGSISVTSSGGTGSYNQYQWTPNVSTTNNASNLSANNYSVKVIDSNGCSGQNNITLTQPAALSVSLASSGGKGGYDVSCLNKTDGAITTTPSGGVAGYSYLWSTASTSNSISSLGIGTYSVTLKDKNNCTASKNIILSAPQSIDFNIAQTSPLNCPGDQTASLDIAYIINNIGTVNYLWSSGETTKAISDKGAGNYSVTISDSQGCSTQKSLAITNPLAQTVSIIPQSNFNGALISCNNADDGNLGTVVKNTGNQTVTASYYEWFKDGNPYDEGAAKSTVDQLSKGQYKVVITYNSQCKAESIYGLDDPDPITVDVSATTNYHGQVISCFGKKDANLKANVNGGTGSYTYLWNNNDITQSTFNLGAATYLVDVTDVNGCTGTGSLSIADPPIVQAQILSFSDYAGFGISCTGTSDGMVTAGGSGGTGVYAFQWSNSKTTPGISALSQGNYSVTVADNNGCQSITNHDITSPPVLNVDIANKKDINCFNGNDGSISLNSSGGAGQYQYSIDGTTWQTSATFSNLNIGDFLLHVRDQNNCVNATTTTLTEPPQLAISFTGIAPAFCDDPRGGVTGIASGGIENYNYEWRDSKNQIISTTDNLTNVPADIYSLNVIDSHSCAAQNTIGITSTDGAKSTYQSVDAKCFASADGSALISIVEGDAPLKIQWPNGQNTLQGTNLKKGTYNVLITDAHDCVVVQAIDVHAPPPLQLQVKNQTIPTCNGLCDGQMELEASGGVGVYTYQWNGKNNALQTQLCSKVYPITVTDGNSCELNQSIQLLQPVPLTVSLLNEILPACKDGCDGSFKVLANGGNGVYSYAWADGGTLDLKDNICPGNYNLNVTDQKGCKTSSTFTLHNTPRIQLDLGGSVTLCVGQNYTLDAGSDWASVKWSSNTGFMGTDHKVTIKDPGQYWLETLNSKGCIAQDTFLLQTSYDLLKARFLMPDKAYTEDTVVFIDISWPLPEKFEWSYPKKMQKIEESEGLIYGKFDSPGIYEINLKVMLGDCKDNITKSIFIFEGKHGIDAGRLGYEEFVRKFTLHPNPNDGDFDVSVELLEEGPITISVWNTVNPQLKAQFTDSGMKLYLKHIDLRPLSSGTYLLRLDYAKGYKTIRFVVY